MFREKRAQFIQRAYIFFIECIYCFVVYNIHAYKYSIQTMEYVRVSCSTYHSYIQVFHIDYRVQERVVQYLPFMHISIPYRLQSTGEGCVVYNKYSIQTMEYVWVLCSTYHTYKYSIQTMERVVQFITFIHTSIAYRLWST